MRICNFEVCAVVAGDPQRTPPKPLFSPPTARGFGSPYAPNSPMKGGRSDANEALENANWQALLNQAILYATQQVNRLRWRGKFGGVLPDGYDPESIAAQAVADLLQQQRGASGHQSINPTIPQTTLAELRR